jgi:hypothetical protein
MPRGVAKYLFRILHRVWDTSHSQRQPHDGEVFGPAETNSRGSKGVVHLVYAYSPSTAPPPPTLAWACMHHVHTERVSYVWVTVRRPRAVGVGGPYREK